MPKEKSDGYERLTDIAVGMKNEGVQVSTVLQNVIEQYIALKNVFSEYYQENLKRWPQHVERICNDFVNSAENVKDNANHVADLLTDMSQPAISSVSLISKLFANSVVLLLTASFSSFIGAYIFAPFFNLIFLRFGAILIATFLIPLMARYFFYNMKVRSLIRPHRIHQSGELAGHPTHHRCSDCRFICLSVGTRTHNRKKQDGRAVAGASMLLQLALGALALHLSSGFFVVASLYTLLTVAVVQLAIAYCDHPEFEEMHLTMQYVLGISLVKMYSLMAFGTEETFTK
ncbi:unnamed protein product [Caenorhabditis sp. 36 PRJEB53466]|nr:unnamed protein product [Caenorhabditis sp. 36 PRJEB53466]